MTLELTEEQLKIIVVALRNSWFQGEAGKIAVELVEKLKKYLPQ